MGLIVTEGLRKYQESKRHESEDKVLISLLKSPELCGTRRIWLDTKIYKNNIQPILSKLIMEKKIIKVDNVRIRQYYHDSKEHLHQRTITTNVYLPNLKNSYVFSLVKEKIPRFFYAQKRKWVRKGVRDFLKVYEEEYKNLTVEEAFARDKGTLASFDRLSKGNGDEIIYGTSVGKALLVILDLLKLLPGKGYTIKELDKRFKTSK